MSHSESLPETRVLSHPVANSWLSRRGLPLGGRLPKARRGRFFIAQFFFLKMPLFCTIPLWYCTKQAELNSRGRASHGTSFLAPGSLARRRLARAIHHHHRGRREQKAAFPPSAHQRRAQARGGETTTALRRHRFGTGAALVRHWCGTGAAPVRHWCGTGAELMRIACGTPAERRRNGGVASSGSRCVSYGTYFTGLSLILIRRVIRPLLNEVQII